MRARPCLQSVLAVTLAYILVPAALAAPVNWLNPGTGFWDDAANWSGAALPGSLDAATIDFGTAATATIRQFPGAPGNAFTRYQVDSLVANSPLVHAGGSLMVTGDATFNESFTWSGGALQVDAALASGTWTFGKGIHLVAGDLVGMNGGKLELQGASVLEGGRGILFGLMQSAHLAAGASLEIRSGDLLSFNGAFVNDGSIDRTSGIGTFAIAFGGGDNNGLVRNRTGSLLIRNSGVANHAGTFTVDAGAELRFANTQTFTGDIAGAGDVHFVNFADFTVTASKFTLGGTLHLEDGAKGVWVGDGTIGTLRIAQGTFKPEGNVAVTNPVIARGAAFFAGAPGSRTRLLGGVDLAGSVVVFSGGLELGGQTVVQDGSGIGINSGAKLTVAALATLRLSNDTGGGGVGAILGGGEFLNQGLILRDTGSGIFTIGPALVNAGRVALRSGQLNFLGDFTQTADGVLDVELGSSAAPLVIAGRGSFAGVLAFGFAPGFVPTRGQVFTIFNCGVCAGSLALAPVGEAARDGYSYVANFGAGTYTLEVAALAAPVPEPATWGLLFAGLALIGALRGRKVGRPQAGARRVAA